MMVLIASNAGIARINPDLIVRRISGQSLDEVTCAMPVIAHVHVYAVYKKHHGNHPLSDFTPAVKA